MECLCCMEDLDDSIKVLKQDSNVYMYCYKCILIIKETKILNFINDFKKEDCLASIKRMLESGMPTRVDKEDIFYNTENISFITDKKDTEKINKINIKLKEILLKYDEYHIKEEGVKIISTFL